MLKKFLFSIRLLLLASLSVVSSQALPAVTLNVTADSPGKINLSWTTTNPAFWYQIQRSYNGIDFFNIANATPGTTEFTDSLLYYGTLYWYHIIAHNPATTVTENSNTPTTSSPTALPAPAPLFKDSFDSIRLNSAWRFLGGSWRQKAGLLEQIDNTTPIDIKKAILIDQTYPDDQSITAKVRVTGWSGNNTHVGVGILTDPGKGLGYELVFHGNDQIQFLNQGVAYGKAFAFPWKLGKWYWFKLTNQNGTLLGKVWPDGTIEPTNWMFEQTGWTDRVCGNPALDGGTAYKNSSASAVFDAVTITGTKTRQLPFSIGGDPSVNPARFRITTFASGLNYPHSMQQLPDQSILVSTSDPIPRGNYFASTGTLLRLIDTQGDGVADGPPEIKYSGLPGPLTALQVAGNLVFVTSSKNQNESISILRMGATPGAPYTLVGTLHFSFPTTNWEHTTYALAIRATPGGNAGDYDLFFNVGSESNNAADTNMVSLTGLLSGVVHGSSIYMVQIHDTGTAVLVNNLTQIAEGLRNAAGIAFDPASGDLYFEDNGMDTPFNANEPLSVDTLHRIPKDQIGTRVFNFGFPHSYIAYRTGIHVGPPTISPVAAFQPWNDPYVGSESEGASEIAIAPANFPAELSNGIFIGFHGRFSLAGVENEENPLVFYNRATGKYFDFISNDEPNMGHLDGLLATSTALFISELCKNGNPAREAGAGMGIIYKIEARATDKANE